MRDSVNKKKIDTLFMHRYPIFPTRAIKEGWLLSWKAPPWRGHGLLLSQTQRRHLHRHPPCAGPGQTPLNASVALRPKSDPQPKSLRIPGEKKSSRPPPTGMGMEKGNKGEKWGPGAPHEEGYRALLLDLMLYRRETLLPVLRGFKKERRLLEKRLVQLDRKVKELCEVRESIKTMILKYEDTQRKNLQGLLEPPQGALPRTSSQVEKEKISDIETIEF